MTIRIEYVYQKRREETVFGVDLNVGVGTGNSCIFINDMRIRFQLAIK